MSTITKKAKEFYLRVRAGQHSDSSGRIYKRGDIVVSKLDLRKVWPNKFDRVSKAEFENPDDEDESEEAEVSKPTKDPLAQQVNLKASGSKWGNNITHQFPQAGKLGLAVFEKDGEYNVVDPVKADVTLKTVSSETRVEKYLNRRLAE